MTSSSFGPPPAPYARHVSMHTTHNTLKVSMHTGLQLQQGDRRMKGNKFEPGCFARLLPRDSEHPFQALTISFRDTQIKSENQNLSVADL